MARFTARPRSLALRLVAGAALWIATALLVGGFLLSSLFRGYVEGSFDARLLVLLESLVVVSEVGPDGAFSVGEAPGEPRFERVFSGWYWEVFADGATAARSRSLWDQTLSLATLPAAAGAVVGFASTGPEGEGLRAIARDITLPGSERVFRYAVAAAPNEVERQMAAFNTALAWSLGALGAGLLAALLIQVRYGLQPLRRVRAALVAIRVGEAKRLRGDFPVEIVPLSDEINNLLDHNAAVVKRARTHVSNLAHALKTPLAVLAGEAEGAEGPLAETVRRQAAAMRGHIEHNLARARAAASGTVLGARAELAPAIDDLCRTLERIHAERRLRIDAAVEPGLAYRGERQDLEEMLGNLIDNACKWGRARIEVRALRRAERCVVTVDDDGPGLSPDQRAGLFERGMRLDEHVPGSGHGLAIVRDIAELYGGDVRLEGSPLGGLRAVLTLPAAESAR